MSGYSLKNISFVQLQFTLSLAVLKFQHKAHKDFLKLKLLRVTKSLRLELFG